jgi:hypothetical protein
MDLTKQLLQSLSPEYLLKKKAGLRLHTVQTALSIDVPLSFVLPSTLKAFKRDKGFSMLKRESVWLKNR